MQYLTFLALLAHHQRLQLFLHAAHRAGDKILHHIRRAGQRPTDCWHRKEQPPAIISLTPHPWFRLRVQTDDLRAMIGVMRANKIPIVFQGHVVAWAVQPARDHDLPACRGVHADHAGYVVVHQATAPVLGGKEGKGIEPVFHTIHAVNAYGVSASGGTTGAPLGAVVSAEVVGGLACIIVVTRSRIASVKNLRRSIAVTSSPAGVKFKCFSLAHDRH